MERIVQLHNLLLSGARLSTAEMCERFEVSRATAMRDVAFLRDRFGAEVLYDRDTHKYSLSDAGGAGRIQVPGLWLEPDEAYALLTLYNVMSALDPGLLQNYIEPLRLVLWKAIGERVPMRGFNRKIRIEITVERRACQDQFITLSRALIEELPMSIQFTDKRGGRRTVTRCRPYRLVLRADGWHIDFRILRQRRRIRVPLTSISSAAVIE